MANKLAPIYAEEYLVGRIGKLLGLESPNKDSLATALEDPLNALKCFFGHYAFARRGKDRDDLSHFTLEAINRLVQAQTFEAVLEQPDGASLWDQFEAICQEKKRKSNEQQNRGPIQGMLELAQEIHRLDPELSLATWVTDAVLESSSLEPVHLRIVDIRGVGPKSASTFLRDMVWLYDVEAEVEASDRLLTQPVDRWLRSIVKYVVPEPGLEDPADWVVAGKISKYTRRAGVSGIQFNMGVSYFGQRVVGDPVRLADCLRELIVNEIESVKDPQ